MALITKLLFFMLFSIHVFFSINIFAVNIDNFDNDGNQADQDLVADGAWWDIGDSINYKIAISSTIYSSPPYSLEVLYQKETGNKNACFQVDLTQDPSNHTDWTDISTKENGLMQIEVRSDKNNTKVQFQLCTNTQSNEDYWSNHTETYNLKEANTWYKIEVDWENYKNVIGGEITDFNFVKRLNINIDTSSEFLSGYLYLDNFSSIDASLPDKPTYSALLAKLQSLKQYFGVNEPVPGWFIDSVALNTFLFFCDPRNINLTYGLPRTGFDPSDLTAKIWSNPTEWGYYLNSLIVGKEFGYINDSIFTERTIKSITTLIQLQNNSIESYKGQFYTYYFVKDVSGDDSFPTYDNSQSWLPSIDNAFLAGCLMIEREYARFNCYNSISIKDYSSAVKFIHIANLADSVAKRMDFSIYWSEDHKKFSHGVVMPGNSLMGAYWDVFGNETPYLTEIARILGNITDAQANDNLLSLLKKASHYTDSNNFSIIVQSSNWDGSLFTYFAPSFHINIDDGDFDTSSALPAVISQMLWAKDNKVQNFGWSDIMASNTIEGGAPPSLHRTQIGWIEEIGIFPNIAPYCYFIPLNLVHQLNIDNILKEVIDICLYKAYQLYKTNVWSGNYDPLNNFGFFLRCDNNGLDNAHYFGTLDQFYILASIFNYQKNLSQNSEKDFRDYFNNYSIDENVSLLSPIDNSTNIIDSIISFSWTSSKKQSHNNYLILISDDSTFKTVIISDTTKDTSYVAKDTIFTEDTSYFWTVFSLCDSFAVSVEKPFTFKIDSLTHTITASADSNGSISPVGEVIVYNGDDQKFTITPDTLYIVKDVLVDGASVGAYTTYPFDSVTADHTINATFDLETNISNTEDNETGIRDNIFTIFPNPVKRNVDFLYFAFTTKKYVNANLCIYDCIGNIVYKNNYHITPKDLPNYIQNIFGSWDLKNFSGRKISSGTYLAVLKTKDFYGKIDIFKSIIGVKGY